MSTTAATTTTTEPSTTSTATTEATTACLPRYGQPMKVLEVWGAYEPGIHVGEFTGDGLDDVLLTWSRFATPDTFEVDLLVNDGGGGLVADNGSITGGLPTTAMTVLGGSGVADFNGDGRDDVFLGDYGMDAPPHPGAQNVLLLSGPGGTLTNATPTLPQSIDNPHDVAVGDADGDGDLDILVVSVWGSPEVAPYLLLNDGSGDFVIGGTLPPDLELRQNWFTSAAFSDVDRDGDQDLVMGVAGEFMGNTLSVPGSMVLLNDGAARFAPLPGALPAGPFPDDAVGGLALNVFPTDLTGDGYPDLIFDFTRNSYVGRMIQVLINNGDGTFRDETSTRFPLSVNSDPAFGRVELIDFDRNGAVDVLARPWDPDDPEPLVYLNDGSGSFSAITHDFNIEWLYFEFLDLDGDGGRDIVVAWATDGSGNVPVEIIRDLGC